MKNVENSIIELREAKWSCSQATLVGIFRGLERSELPESLLKSAVVTLRGGIGRTCNEGSCGALTAGAVALGLLFPEDGEKATKLTTELFKNFKEKFGSAMCGAITNENGKKRCTECCLHVGCKVEEMYRREENGQ